MNTMTNVMELINNAWMNEGSNLKVVLTSKTVNGIEIEGLRITEKDDLARGKIEPVIYPDVNDTIVSIKELCEKAYEETKAKDFNIPDLSKDYILKRAYVDVSSKDNLKSYRNHDHLIVLCSDLDIIMRFRILLNTTEDTNGTTNASAIITNKLAERYNISEEELIKASIDNTSKKAVVTSLFEAIKEIAPMEDLEIPDQPLMVAKTTNNFCGAGVIACKDFLSFLYNRFGDYYILPSSIHEILILPMKYFRDANVEDLQNMVKDVNNTAVDPKDKLTDTVYKVQMTEEGIDLIIA